ncbi:hypothetical protein Q1695_010364 [Nippostrongylus brasiliensis]|nr:hypothetical protein Q1695_010364 [Nippostrongylus brasiliensis]
MNWFPSSPRQTVEQTTNRRQPIRQTSGFRRETTPSSSPPQVTTTMVNRISMSVFGIALMKRAEQQENQEKAGGVTSGIRWESPNEEKIHF